MKKKRLCNAIIFLLVVLLLSGLILFASGSSTIYLMSVNDKVVEMTAENMPLVFGNQLYIPYIMLSSQTTGLNLGVRANYNANRGTLTVTDGQQAITFDTKRNTAHDAWGTPLEARALIRQSMAYLPIEWLCTYFDGLDYSLTSMSYGVLVRLTNSAVILNDVDFIDAADTMLRQNLQEYRASLITPTQPTKPTPTQNPTTTLPPEVKPGPLVYLAFRCGDQTSDVADFLEEEGQRALFFFDCEQMVKQDDLVRRLIGRGHQVGLTLVGSDMASCLSQLEYARELMNDISRGQLLILSADELSRRDQRMLAEEGSVIWSADLQADDLTRGALLDRLSLNRPNFVEMTCNQHGLDILAGLMSSVRTNRLRLGQTLVPLL